jgi:16S rRNA G1207 methylase RsmC
MPAVSIKRKSKRQDAFELIKKEYKSFYESLLKKGTPPVWETEKGIFGTSSLDNVFELFQDIHLEKYKSFIDLGSGDGCVVLVASLFTKAAGIEFDRELHKKAVAIRDKLNLKAELVQGDFLEHDLGKYDIIFINPDQGFHKGLGQKLQREMKGELLVYNFVFQPYNLKKGRTLWFRQVPVTFYTNYPTR